MQYLGLMNLSRFLCIEAHRRITGLGSPGISLGLVVVDTGDKGRQPWISSTPCLAPRMAAASRWLLEFDIMAIGSFFKQGSPFLSLILDTSSYNADSYSLLPDERGTLWLERIQRILPLLGRLSCKMGQCDIEFDWWVVLPQSGSRGGTITSAGL